MSIKEQQEKKQQGQSNLPRADTLAWVEAAKNFVEILALIISGIWAYTHYFSGEAPSLEARASLITDATWAGPKAGVCMAKLRTSIKNIGKTSFDLKSIRLDVWLTSYRPSSDQSIKRFDPEAIMSTPSSFTDVLQSGSITGHYPPDVELTDDYFFVVPDSRATAAPGEEKVALFRFAGTAVDADKKEVPLTDWAWTDVCEDVERTVQQPSPQPVQQQPSVPPQQAKPESPQTTQTSAAKPRSQQIAPQTPRTAPPRGAPQQQLIPQSPP